MIYCSTESENPSDLNTKWEKNIIKSSSPQRQAACDKKAEISGFLP